MPRSFSGRPVLPAQARTHGRTWKCWLSWLAVSEHALVSRLTKQPSPLGRDLSNRPRGELPLAFAADEGSTCTAVGAVHAELDPAQYNPCRMLNAGRQPGFPLLCGLRGALERRICAPPLSVAMQPSVTPSRRYTGDRRSPKPFGRITQDTRVILASFFDPICGDDHPCISR